MERTRREILISTQTPLDELRPALRIGRRQRARQELGPHFTIALAQRENERARAARCPKGPAALVRIDAALERRVDQRRSLDDDAQRPRREPHGDVLLAHVGGEACAQVKGAPALVVEALAPVCGALVKGAAALVVGALFPVCGDALVPVYGGAQALVGGALAHVGGEACA